MSDDPRIQAARYLVARAADEDRAAEERRAAGARGSDAEGRADTSAVDAEASSPAAAQPQASPARNAHERALYVETAIQQAIRRGEFDDLPGAGKPLEGLGDHHDPDWWIRRKIQSEQLTGLGPPALMLRAENGEFAERADALPRESDVREYVENFNRRVIEARRQLQGGPPVVTPTRDVEAEVAAWHERRRARAAATEAGETAPRGSDVDDAGGADPSPPRRRRWLRRSGR